MKKFEDIVNVTEFQERMTDEINRVFGEGEFSNSLYLLISDIIDDYVSFGYHTWLYGNNEVVDSTTIARFTSFVHRWLLKKYNKLEFFKNRWSLLNGTEYGIKETKERTFEKDRDIITNITENSQRDHNSTTTMRYTSNDSTTTSDEASANSMDENAPLGATETITTPYNKDKSSSTASGTALRDREDTQNTTVVSSDEGASTSNSTSQDNEDHTENTVTVYDNGVEILKAIKYNNTSIMDVLVDIMDRTVQEYNEVL